MSLQRAVMLGQASAMPGRMSRKGMSLRAWAAVARPWMRWCLSGGVWLARLADKAWSVTPDVVTAGAEAEATASGGGIGAFESFVRQYERQILNYLWRVTGDEQAAYDLTQETFVRAWRHFDSISRYEQPHGWLFRVATNLALSHKSAGKRRMATTEHDLFEGDSSPTNSDVARRIVERDLVRAVLAQLPARRRAALVLREVYGFSIAEVATTLAMSEPAVRMALSRARAQFRQLYEREEGLP